MKILILLFLNWSFAATLLLTTVVGGDRAEASDRQGTSREDDDSASFSRLTYDIGLASGSVNTYNYTEFELGFNFFFEKWIAWRNAIFDRITSDQPNSYGLDSSVRGILKFWVYRICWTGCEIYQYRNQRPFC